MSQTLSRSSIWKNGYPFSTDVGMSNSKPFITIDFKVPLPNEAFEVYRKFLPLNGEGLEMSKRILKTLGFTGKLANLTNQGIHNNSKVIHFGDYFEIEIQEIKNKLTIGDIKKGGFERMKSSLSLEQAEKALSGISVDGDEPW